jgi:hypothetical protein
MEFGLRFQNETIGVRWLYRNDDATHRVADETGRDQSLWNGRKARESLGPNGAGGRVDAQTIRRNELRLNKVPQTNFSLGGRRSVAFRQSSCRFRK